MKKQTHHGDKTIREFYQLPYDGVTRDDGDEMEDLKKLIHRVVLK